VKLGAFFFGGVELDDAGPGPPAATDRRASNEQVWRSTLDYVGSATEAERLGYDSFWMTEHHFQHEGYEVIPNGIQIATWIAARTNRIRLGTMFNVVPQWNPLRLAEDFATLHNLSGGRAILGVGRGTVPREVLHLNDKGVSIGSYDNPEKAADDHLNREVFEESMEIIRLALDSERFSFAGKHFRIPVPGIPDRGGTVQKLTLVPRPLYPYDVWQAVTSPPTLEYVPVVGHGAVFWNQHYSFIKRFWDEYGERYAAAHGEELAAGDKRMLVISVRVEDTHEKAVETATPGHDEFWKFLEPRVHGSRRQAGPPRPHPDARRVDRPEDDPPRDRGRGRGGGRVLPRHARPRALDDLPAPARRPVQEGRRADGPLRRRGPPAPLIPPVLSVGNGRFGPVANDSSGRTRI
jgi:alkanesulfonate monooxygenase SsuD/methylene tetrahydromethanopterin reductase-like flavin-dependent oxidoreductase (luciferase family)